MRLFAVTALCIGLSLPTMALAAPQAGGTAPRTTTTSQRLAQCDKIKTPAARQDCRKKVLAAKPAAKKPAQTAQHKPAPKKPATVRATGTALPPSGTSTM